MIRPSALRALAFTLAFFALEAVAAQAPSRRFIDRLTFGLSPTFMATEPVALDVKQNYYGARFVSLVGLDRRDIVALRAEVNILQADGGPHSIAFVNGGQTTNSSARTSGSVRFGGVGAQFTSPSVLGLRPYANVVAGISSVTLTKAVDEYMPTTSGRGLGWRAGGGVFFPVTSGSMIVNADLGVRWQDNGIQDFMGDELQPMPGGPAFTDDQSWFGPRFDERNGRHHGVEFSAGVTVSFGRRRR